MEINRELRELINEDASVENITNAALRNGMKTFAATWIDLEIITLRH